LVQGHRDQDVKIFLARHERHVTWCGKISQKMGSRKILEIHWKVLKFLCWKLWWPWLKCFDGENKSCEWLNVPGHRTSSSARCHRTKTILLLETYFMQLSK